MKGKDNDRKDRGLAGHCAIVTGACGGIGSAFALELASRGCDLLLVDLDEQRLFLAADAILDKASCFIFTLPLDLTAPDAIKRLDAYCRENGIFPDILINNAGIFSFAPVAETKTKRIETFIDLHIRAVTMLSRWFANLRMPEGSGFILNMSSMSCWMPMPGLAMYAATKSYIRVFSRSLHYELKDSGVSVTVACPGGIATDLFGLPPKLRKLAVRIGVLATPERFARKAVERMLKRKKQYINGWLNRLSIFFVGITPTPVRMMVKHRMLDKGIVR